MKKLSEMKISERIRAVKHDVELCMEDTDIEFEMEGWVSTDYENGVCSVCVAGAYMYKSMEIRRTGGILRYSEEEQEAVESFDSLRTGAMRSFLLENKLSNVERFTLALQHIYDKWEEIFDEETKADSFFSEDIDVEFLLMMEDCAKYLESEGL